MAFELKITWEDEDGVTTTQTMSVSVSDPGDPLISNLIAALGDLSEAAITEYSIQNSYPLVDGEAVPAVTGGAYDMADKLVFEATDSAGAVRKVSFPAPKGALLDDSDHVSTADLTGVDFQAYFDAVSAMYKTPDDRTLVTLLRAYRERTSRSDLA